MAQKICVKISLRKMVNMYYIVINLLQYYYLIFYEQGIKKMIVKYRQGWRKRGK